MPFGIVSIVYAASVNGKLQAGDYQGALAASNNAKLWFWLAVILGIVPIFVMLVLSSLGSTIGDTMNEVSQELKIQKTVDREDPAYTSDRQFSGI